MLNKSQIKELMQELMPDTQLDDDSIPVSQTVSKPRVVRSAVYKKIQRIKNE